MCAGPRSGKGLCPAEGQGKTAWCLPQGESGRGDQALPQSGQQDARRPFRHWRDPGLQLRHGGNSQRVPASTDALPLPHPLPPHREAPSHSPDVNRVVAEASAFLYRIGRGETAREGMSEAARVCLVGGVDGGGRPGLKGPPALSGSPDYHA